MTYSVLEKIRDSGEGLGCGLFSKISISDYSELDEKKRLPGRCAILAEKIILLKRRSATYLVFYQGVKLRSPEYLSSSIVNALRLDFQHDIIQQVLVAHQLKPVFRV